MSSSTYPDSRFMNGSGNPGDNSIVMLSSYEGEDSFVVLGRATANDLDMNGDSTLSQQSQVDCSYPLFQNHLTNGLSTSQLSNHFQVVPNDASTVTSVSAEDIDKRLQEVLQENIILKENLRQTNLAMKQQLSTVSLLQDRALDAQKKQQAKFEETKALILSLGSEKNCLLEANEVLNKEIIKLKEENKELNKAAFAFKEETAKLVIENASFQNQIQSMQESIKSLSENNLKNPSLKGPSVKEVELHDLVDQLSRKLEVVERAKRQQELDIDKLQAQLGRVNVELTETQRKLALSENAVQIAKSQPQSKSETPLVPIYYGEKLTKYDNVLKQLKVNIQEEQNKCNSLSSWLTMNDSSVNVNSAQFEISELRRLLAQEQTQSVARKENLYQAASTLQEMLVDFQKLGEELECVKADFAVKESHGLLYEEMKKKGFSEKIDELTAQLVQKDEALAISERHLASLQEAVRLQHSEKKGDGEMLTLKEQINVLTKEVEGKEEKIQSHEKQVAALKAELQTLHTTKETVTILEEQAKIYQADFEAERKSRELLAAEKDRLIEDLRHLQRRNQELFDELRKVRIEVHHQAQRPSSPPQQQPASGTSPPTIRPDSKVICPITECFQSFSSVSELNQHMFTCWNKRFSSTFLEPRKLKCEKCSEACGKKQVFRSWEDYSLHLKLQHYDKKEEQKTKLVCSSCNITSNNIEWYENHVSICGVKKCHDDMITLKLKETEKSKLSCPNCTEGFDNEKSLTEHVYECWGIWD